MNYSEPGFEITLTNNTLIFSGKLEKSDYTDIDKFLREVDQALKDALCIIDLANLSFLNSSGIRSLATFMLGSPKKFEIQINNTITWQTESIPTLTFLKPEGITIAS
jgi:hypothetical protein